MKPFDLKTLARAIYGQHWVTELSRDMGRPRRSLQRWARQTTPLRAQVLGELYSALRGRWRQNRTVVAKELFRLNRQTVKALHAADQKAAVKAPAPLPSWKEFRHERQRPQWFVTPPAATPVKRARASVPRARRRSA